MHHHAASFRRISRNESLADAVARDAASAPLAPSDLALVRYSTDLTKDPAGSSGPRVEALRGAGFEDEAILAATEITAYFNFVNRIVEGLGVELEGESG